MARSILGSGRPASRYGFAALMVALAGGVAVEFRPLWEGQPSSPFLLAVLIVAWAAGYCPAVGTCALSLAVIAYLVAGLLLDDGEAADDRLGHGVSHRLDTGNLDPSPIATLPQGAAAGRALADIVRAAG